MRNLVVIGVGELGKLFGAAALRVGIRVTPITRHANADEILADVVEGTPMLVAVGERELPDVLHKLPAGHRSDIILLQNELFPSCWREHDLEPTVMIPWVLQKRGVPTQVAGDTPYFGAHGPLVAELLDAAGVPGQALADERALHQALVNKYTFILTINALGMLVDRTLGLWLQEDPTLVGDVCSEATRLGEALCNTRVDGLIARHATEQGMRALSAIPARGRTAPERLQRALGHATRLGLLVPTLASCLPVAH